MKGLFISAILNLVYFVTFGQTFDPQSSPQQTTTSTKPIPKVEKGFILLIGPAVTYYKGPGSQDITPLMEERVNWQANGQLGYVFNSNNVGRGNTLAVFATAGLMNKYSLNQLFVDQNLDPTVLTDRKSNVFYQLEAGMYIGEILRLSSGIGRQQYYISEDETKSLHYLSSTVGLSLSLGVINWVIDFNWVYGKDFSNLVLKPSTGILVKF